MSFFDKSFTPGMFFFRIFSLLMIPTVISLMFGYWLPPLVALLVFIVVNGIAGKAIDATYWQLVISWQLLVSRFKS